MAQTNNDAQQENNVTVEEKNDVNKEVNEDIKPVEGTEKVEENNLTVEVKNGVDKETDEDIKPVDGTEKVAKDEEETENPNVNSESTNEKTEEPSTVLLEKIKKQVEFYFGDVNMQRDKFLTEQIKLDDGWIPMTVMLNFKILASLSKDIEVILKALENSELIEISEDKKKIRRSLEKPLPIYDENYKKAQEAKTIYLKGFPASSTMESLKNYFDSTMDVIENIIMRKYKKGKEYFFKGSIFLQFKALDDAKAYMEQSSVEYNGTELIKMWAVDYAALKEKEREERRQKKAKSQNNQTNTSLNEKNNTQNKVKLPKGCIIYFSNVKPGIKREEIKEKLIQLDSEVAYIDYSNGDIEGWIRLQGENSAVNLFKKLESNTINVEGCDISCKLLEGEEEEAYLVKIQESMTNRRLNRRDRGHQRKGFKRGHSPHRDGNTKKPNLCDS